MGKAVIIALALVIGFVMGLVAMSYWNERSQLTPPSAATEQNTSYTESYFMCKWPHGNRESALIIRSDRSGAKTMKFPWKSEADEFRIEQTTDMYYKAIEASPELSEASASLELNRISGDLFITSRAPNDVVKLLADICDKRIPPNECRSRIEKIPGGSWVDCVSVANDLECPKWRSGSNLRGRYRYECRSVERRF